MVDCVVVGAGLIGMLTARELAAAGVQVMVVERGQAGRESSWAGGGILSPLYPWRYDDAVSALAHWGQREYPQLAEALREDSGTDPEWTRSGLLILDSEERAQASAWADRLEVALTPVTESEARALEPRLGPGAGPGLWLPQVAQVRNPRLVQALRGSLLARGIQLREGTEVTGLRLARGRATAVATTAGDIPAGAVIVAGGAWSAGLLRPLGLDLPVEPVRGQMLLFRTDPGTVSRIVLSRDRYVIPRRDGRVLVGSTLERVGFDKSTTAQARAELHGEARRLIPALADYPVERHWAGLRPGSPQGVPYIGEHAGIAGLFVSTGHFRNGVVLGPASARLLADLYLGRPPSLDPAPYALPAA